jgi:hypothetical protein
MIFGALEQALKLLLVLMRLVGLLLMRPAGPVLSLLVVLLLMVQLPVLKALVVLVQLLVLLVGLLVVLVWLLSGSCASPVAFGC